MKKKLTLLTLAILLVLAACGNKTDAPASAGTSENASKESEKEIGAVESVVKEVSDAIEEAAKPQQGDVTNKMYFTEDVSFTSSTLLEFGEWRESGSLTESWYSWDKDPNSGIAFQSGDDYAFGYSLYNPLNTPEGAYKSEITIDGFMYLYFETEGKDGRKYGIAVNANEPTEEHVALFLQLVGEFLDSGVVTDAKMSDILFDTGVLSETIIADFFTSPDAIAAE